MTLSFPKTIKRLLTKSMRPFLTPPLSVSYETTIFYYFYLPYTVLCPPLYSNRVIPLYKHCNNFGWFYTGWGKSWFTIVSIQNRVYPCIIINYYTIFHTNCKPHFATPCICCLSNIHLQLSMTMIPLQFTCFLVCLFSFYCLILCCASLII